MRERATKNRFGVLDAQVSRAVEAENDRIAALLHDELGQTLATIRMRLSDAIAAAEAGTARELRSIRALVDRSIESTRSLTFQLSPSILHDLGLGAALLALGEQAERDHGFRFVGRRVDGWTDPAPDDAAGLYRVVRELLHNVSKHARASRVRLEMGGDGAEIWIALDDDGVGCARLAAARGTAGHASGLRRARERMQQLGGGLELDSAPGRGTRARVTLPAGGRVERRRSERRQAR